MEDEIIDYASLSDAELSPIIYDLLNQGLSENEINQKLWGPSIDNPSDNNINPNWENILSTNPDLANVISEEPRVDDYLGTDLLNPSKKIDNTISLPSYKKKINQMAYWPGKPSKNEAFENQLRANGDITGDETIVDFFEKNGWERSFDKNVDGYSMEIWKNWEKIPEQIITEDEYNRQEGIYEGYDLVGYKNDLSFAEYAKAWNVEIGENIRDFDPQFSERQRKEISKTQSFLHDLGNITNTSEEFINILPTNAAIDVEDEFFKVIRDTGELLDLDENSTKDELQTADFTERDAQIVTMFGEEKGQEMINYLNNNPQEYLNMIDANPLFGEGFSNLSGAMGDDGEGPGDYWDTIEKQNTSSFLTNMGVIQQKEKVQGGIGFNPPEYTTAPQYQAWLESENGQAQRYKLLQDYKSRKIRKFLNDNDLGNTYFTGEWGEGFRRVSGRDRDGSELYGYSSEAILLGTPENQQIYSDNKKTQAEFIKAAEEINYTGFGRGFGGSLNLKIGEPITLDSPNWGKPRTFYLKPYQLPEVEQEYINKTSQVISDVADAEIAKYNLISEKGAPYFKAIEDANTALGFFDTHDEWYQAYPGGIDPSQREAYTGIIKQRNKAIANLTDSGLFESLNDQAAILNGLEELNNVFMDQAETLSNSAMMSAAAIKNPSNWLRAANAFSQTAMEFTLALEQVAIDVEEILTPETLDIVINTPFFGPNMTSTLAETLGKKLDDSPSEEYKAQQQIILDQYEKMYKDTADEFAPKIDYKTYLPGEGWDYVKQTLAESAPTLAMVMGPSLVARLGTKSFVKASMNKVAKDMAKAGATKSAINTVITSPRLRQKFAQKLLNRASTASMGMFIGSSWGSRKMQLDFSFANAEERIEQIKAQLEVIPPENTSGRLELLKMLDNTENILNTPKHLREWDAISYGLIDGFSERLGTLSILNKARRMGKSWKNLTRGEKWKRVGTGTLGAGKSMLIEVGEEFAAQLGHNFTDKVLLKDNKSIFEGMDTNLIADSVVNILAMQTPAYMGNMFRAARDEVTTFKDKQAQAKRGKDIRDLKAKLKTIKDPKERGGIINKIGDLMQEANIAEFSSYQRFRNLTNEEINELVELGGKKSKVTSRYLEHMTMMPIGKNRSQMSKWQKETKTLEAQLTNLRNQQGEILNTAEWKRYQNFTKIANEYTQLKETTEEQDLKYIGAKLQVKKDLGKSFTGGKLKEDTDIVSVLPKEIRNGSYQAYQAFKDLTINFGDIATQNNTDYLEDFQDVMDFQAQENC